MTRFRRRVSPLILLLSIVTGCSELFSPGYDYGRVQVEVVDTSGAPLRAVELILYTGNRHIAYGETDVAGRHLFGFVPAGAYGVAAGLGDTLSVPPGGSNFQVFQIEQGEEVEIRIVLVSGQSPD